MENGLNVISACATMKNNVAQRPETGRTTLPIRKVCFQERARNVITNPRKSGSSQLAQFGEFGHPFRKYSDSRFGPIRTLSRSGATLELKS